MKNRFSPHNIVCLLFVFALFAQPSMAAEDAPKIALSPSSFSDPLDIVAHFDAPGIMPVDIAFDGTNLWCVDAGPNKIYQLDTGGNEISSFDGPGMMPSPSPSVRSICGSPYSKAKRFTNWTLTEMSWLPFHRPSAFPQGLPLTGPHIWASADRKIHKLDTEGRVLTSFDSPGNDPTGLAFDGTHLWNTDSQSNRIHKLDTEGNVLASFDSPADKAYGLAYDGEYLWHTDDGGDRIFQISPRISPARIGASEIRSFTVRNIGDAPLGVEQLAIKGKDAGEFVLKDDECSGQTIRAFGIPSCSTLCFPRHQRASKTRFSKSLPMTR